MRSLIFFWYVLLTRQAIIKQKRLGEVGMEAADLKPGLPFFSWYPKRHYLIFRVEGGIVDARCLDFEMFGTKVEMSVEEFLARHDQKAELDIPYLIVQGIDDEYDACLEGWSKRQDQIFGQVIKEIEEQSPPLLSDSDRDLMEDLLEGDVFEEFEE